MRPFDLEKALAGEPVVTRDGHAVTEIILMKMVTARTNNLLAVIDGDWYIYYRNGELNPGYACNGDLFMAPVKRQEWVNIHYALDRGHKNGQYYFAYTTETFGSEEIAMNFVTDNGVPNYVKSVLIREWEE